MAIAVGERSELGPVWHSKGQGSKKEKGRGRGRGRDKNDTIGPNADRAEVVE